MANEAHEEPSPCYITTEADLRSYVDGHMGPDATPELVALVVERLRRMDCPAWGADWAPWLSSIDDLWALTLESDSDGQCVRDASGGVWWPSDEARAEIEEGDDPDATAERICYSEPMRGRWAD